MNESLLGQAFLVLALGGLATGLVLAAAVSIIGYSVVTGIPPFPTTRRERDAVIALLSEAEPSPGIIYELGCGWGGMARRLARAFPEHRVVGLERSPLVAWVAKIRAVGVPNLEIRCQDFFRSDLSDASAIAMYLMIEISQRLQPKFAKELPAGTPVVSVVFSLRGQTPIKTVPVHGWSPGEAYLYKY